MLKAQYLPLQEGGGKSNPWLFALLQSIADINSLHFRIVYYCILYLILILLLLLLVSIAAVITAIVISFTNTFVSS